MSCCPTSLAAWAAKNSIQFLAIETAQRGAKQTNKPKTNERNKETNKHRDTEISLEFEHELRSFGTCAFSRRILHGPLHEESTPEDARKHARKCGGPDSPMRFSYARSETPQSMWKRAPRLGEPFLCSPVGYFYYKRLHGTALQQINLAFWLFEKLFSLSW